MIEFLNKCIMKIYRIAIDDYKGNHEAPSSDFGTTLDNMTNNEIYPEDIYSLDAVRLYGYSDPFAAQAISIIHQAKNRPNYRVVVYRAVPDVNREINNQIKERHYLISYYDKFHFFPVGNDIIHRLQEDVVVSEAEYDEKQRLIYQEILKEIVELQNKKGNDIKINSGDWVTIVKGYAKEHGEANLGNKFKILQKTVLAKELYNDGDSILEYGWNP